MKRKVLSIFLCFAMLLAAVPMSAFAAEENARKVCASGFCGAQGENLTWTLYDDGELVISGEGEMDWYVVKYQSDGIWGDGNMNPPWYNYYSKIKVITLEEGVTSIGNHAFAGENLGYYRVNLPKSLKYYEGDPFDPDFKLFVYGRARSICYAGTQEEWAENVTKKIYYYKDIGLVEPDGKLYSRRKGNEVQGDRLDYVRNSRHDTMYFAGEEPPVFCYISGDLSDEQVEEGELVRKYAQYNANGREDIQLVWSISGDAMEMSVAELNCTDLDASIVLNPVKYGDVTVTLEMKDLEGNLLASDSETISVYMTKGMNIIQKIEHYATQAFMYTGAFGLWFSFAFGLFLEALLSAPIILVKMIFG
ncbi:MAG: hypothetical protein IJE72_02820 [Clostridia bacterium]|nr:hypothetical protein [Clostridia bacterium]